MPEKPVVALCRTAAGLAAMMVLAGCAYTAEEACVDLSRMVWPWQSMTGVQTETVMLADPAQAIWPEYAINVTGALPPTDLQPEPVPATFQCRHTGETLRSFSWTDPPVLIEPVTRLKPG